MAKVDKIEALLETRIVRGDYAIRPIPAETRLADEIGVSRMTARKAVLRLIDRGLLTRSANGRLRGNPIQGRRDAANDTKRPAKSHRSKSTPLLIGFICPAFGSAEYDRWRVAVQRVVEPKYGRTRILQFHHWDDPVLGEAVDSFDGIFLVPSAEPMPPAVARQLREGQAKVVALDTDLTEVGLRSVDLMPPLSVQTLCDHLAGLGHKSIDCFNTQPLDNVIQQRIEQWSLWRSAQGMGGQLLNDPDQSYGNPPLHAYNVMAAHLDAKNPLSSAVVCLTMPAALGMMRACYERGLKVGKDISICATNDEGIAALLCPSLTTTRMPDPQPYIDQCLRWMAGEQVAGPLLSRPTDVPIFAGESTGPAPR